MSCRHQQTRWLWSEPKEAREAYEQFLSGNGFSDEDMSGLKNFYEKYNIRVCTECGAEMRC